MKKKLIVILSVLAAVALTSCAQSPKATEVVPLTPEEVEAKLKPFLVELEKASKQNNPELIEELALAFVKENENEAGAQVLLGVLGVLKSPQEVAEMAEASDYYKNNEQVREWIDSRVAEMETAEGKMFKDFEATCDGKTTRLSDYVGKGKYVLVDFWASWCGPCRMEIPNIIKVYEKYHGDKFEVLGVATWDEPAETRKAIAADGIPYPQMLNAGEAGSEAYGITGIPQIILFAPDGTILKRGLRGSQVEAAVAEALKAN